MGIGGGIIGGIIGSCIAPGWGTAVGAAIGAWAGEAFGGPKAGGESTFKIKVESKYITIDNDKIEVFEIKFKGVVVAPKDNTPVDFLLLARDCSGGKEFEDGDVIAVSDNLLSSLGNGVLSPKEDFTLPYQCSEHSDWITVFTIPIASLIFPYKGMRDIKFGILVNEKNDNVLAFAEEKITFNVSTIGYMEYDEYWKKVEQLSLEIVGLIVFTNSKCFALETSIVVKDWIKSRIDLRDDANKEQSKKELNATLSRIKKPCEILNDSVIIQKIKKLGEFVRVSDKYSLMDFFIQIVATFENAGEHDLKLLDLIAQELGLDDKEYQDAKHKYLRMHEITETDPFVILGIPSNIPAADKKKKLRELFVKWNALAIHKDLQVRKKSEKMLTCISECQRILNNK